MEDSRKSTRRERIHNRPLFSPPTTVITTEAADDAADSVHEIRSDTDQRQFRGVFRLYLERHFAAAGSQLDKGVEAVP